jgi:hypothetical protein
MMLRGGMSGQRFVYDSERQRHERFVGRAELLARLSGPLYALTPDGPGERWPWRAAAARSGEIA